jgi:hypothetical protein
MPHMRYIAFSYSDGITTRDNNKMTRVIMSPAYQQLWGDRFKLTKLGERRVENDQTGYKVTTSVGGLSTGERGEDRFKLTKLGERRVENDQTGYKVATS